MKRNSTLSREVWLFMDLSSVCADTGCFQSVDRLNGVSSSNTSSRQAAEFSYPQMLLIVFYYTVATDRTTGSVDWGLTCFIAAEESPISPLFPAGAAATFEEGIIFKLSQMLLSSPLGLPLTCTGLLVGTLANWAVDPGEREQWLEETDRGLNHVLSHEWNQCLHNNSRSISMVGYRKKWNFTGEPKN